MDIGIRGSWGQLTHREAVFGNHWLCIYDVNRTSLRLNIFKLKLFREKTHPEVPILRGESGHHAVRVPVNRIDAEQTDGTACSGVL
jgi:hypothetical protein